MQVEVFRNREDGVWSIRDRGRTIASASYVVLKDAHVRVDEYDRLYNPHRPHTFACGTLVAAEGYKRATVNDPEAPVGEYYERDEPAPDATHDLIFARDDNLLYAYSTMGDAMQHAEALSYEEIHLYSDGTSDACSR